MDRLEALGLDPFTSAQAEAAGLSRPALTRAVRSARVQRVWRDAYVRAEVELTLPLRVRAAEVAAGVPLIASHETAAELWGVDVSLPREPGDEPDAPPVVRALVRPGSRLFKDHGLDLAAARVTAREVRVLRGVRVTAPVRTALDLARDRELREAVVVLDVFLRGRTTVRELRAGLDRMAGWRHVRTARAALDLACPLAESPMETRLRVLLVLAGLPTPEVQHEVRTPEGVFVARVDLAYPDERVAVEYDGREQHLEPGRFLHDRHRHHDLVELGWEVLRFTARDVLRDADGVVGRVRRVLSRRAAA